MEFLTKGSTGLLKGSIDFVFPHNDRYYIVDWKTNLLNTYSSDAIASAIENHQYELQARIYSAALCRFLKTTANFGGAFYLFLRGMDLKFRKVLCALFFLENPYVWNSSSSI